MDSPAVFPFVNEDDEDFAISTAGVQIGKAIEDLQGMTALAVYGVLSAAAASGGDVTAYIQTSFAGAPWFDVACIAFGAATSAKVANISGFGLDPTVVTDQALPADTAVDGVLGDRVRAVVVTTGNFDSPSTLALRGHAR